MIMQPAIEKNDGATAKEPRVLVGVCSCRRHARQRAGVRESWAQHVPERVRVAFFVGDGPEGCEPDVWQLACPDTYEALPSKIQAFVRRALLEPDWEFLFKCDDDTYVVTDRLIQLPSLGEFVGSADTAPGGFASGGGGYLMSRRCARLVAEAETPVPGCEDVWVSRTLREQGVTLVATPALRMDHRDFPAPDNDIVTAHWCSPEMMQLVDSLTKDASASLVAESFAATHATWAGPVKLLKGGCFLGGLANPNGRWEMSDATRTLTLNWFHWPADRLTQTTDGYANPTFRLVRDAESSGSGLAAAKPGKEVLAEKLHVGAGANRLLDWINCDLDMDLRQALPKPDESVQFLFAEHVVEHITPEEAWRFFREARRILKPGGVMRIAVPCVDLIAKRHDERYRDFLRGAIGGNGSKEEAVESIICNWGHRAVWTVDGLRAVLEGLGFRTSEASSGVSAFPELNGIDGHGRAIGEHANWVETGVVEAVKPMTATADAEAVLTEGTRR